MGDVLVVCGQGCRRGGDVMEAVMVVEQFIVRISYCHDFGFMVERVLFATKVLHTRRLTTICGILTRDIHYILNTYVYPMPVE